MIRFAGFAAAALLSGLAAWKAYGSVNALFVQKLVPWPELPFALAAAAVTFCAAMTLCAGLRHLSRFLTPKENIRP